MNQANTLSLGALAAPPVPENIWATWNFDPPVLLGLLLLGTLYASGVRALWDRAGSGRGVSHRQTVAFALGLLLLFVALVSPLEALSTALLSAHMVQHLLLLLVVAPLLVAGAPPVALAWAVPRSARSPLARWWHRHYVLDAFWQRLSAPLVVWFLHAAAILLWHLPAFYQAALLNETIHLLEHATFLGVAFLFWWILLQRQTLPAGAAVLFIFTTGLVNGLLGALLTFAAQPWYPAYSVLPYAWGLTPLQDQQLAGVIMWFPASLIYLGAALALLGSWLYRQEALQGAQRPAVATPPRRVQAEVKRP